MTRIFSRKCIICDAFVGKGRTETKNFLSLTCSDACHAISVKRNHEQYSRSCFVENYREDMISKYGDDYFRFPKCVDCDLRYKDIDAHVVEQHKYKDLKDYRKKNGLSVEDTKTLKKNKNVIRYYSEED